MTGILGLGLLSDCDRFSGIIGLYCGVIGGFLTGGASADSEASELMLTPKKCSLPHIPHYMAHLSIFLPYFP